MAANHDDLVLLLNDTSLDHDVISRLAARARPAILSRTAQSEEELISLGAFKIGGRPDLLRGAAWPTRPPYPDGDKRRAAHRKEAARLLADSKKPRSWMTPEQCQRFSLECRARADAVETEFPLAFFGQFNLSDLSREKGFDATFPSDAAYSYSMIFGNSQRISPEASV